MSRRKVGGVQSQGMPTGSRNGVRERKGRRIWKSRTWRVLWVSHQNGESVESGRRANDNYRDMSLSVERTFSDK